MHRKKKKENSHVVDISDEIMLNGTLSSDPDTDPAEDQELAYRWYCKQIAEGDIPEEHLDLEKNVQKIDYPKEPMVDKENGYQGCFGNGFGMLSGKGK